MRMNFYRPYQADGFHAMETIDFKNLLAALQGKGEQVAFTGLRVKNEDGSNARPTSILQTYEPTSDKIEFKIVDKDKDFSGVYLEFDRDPGKGIDNLIFYYDKKSGDLVAVDGGQTYVIDATRSGNTLTGVIDVSDITGFDHGQFGMEIYNPQYGISSFVHVDVGDTIA